jgi:hypothetical protein
MIKILFSFNLHNFGYSFLFDYYISAYGTMYCILFYESSLYVILNMNLFIWHKQWKLLH